MTSITVFDHDLRAMTYEAPALDVRIKDGVLTIIDVYDAPSGSRELHRWEFPLTSVHHWEYNR